MDMRPTSTMQTPSGSFYIDFKAPVPCYSPPPAVTNPLDDFSEPSDPFASHRLQANSMASDIGTFLNESHLPTNLPSLFAACGMHQRDIQPDVFINCHNGDDGSWSGGQLQDLLDFPEGRLDSNGELGNVTEMLPNENLVERSSNWRGPTQENFVEPQWIEFRNVSDEVAQQRKVPQSSTDIDVPSSTFHQQRWLPSAEVFACANSASQSSKPRMRWTQELHEAFVDAVNKLGGCGRATPKAILSLMNVESLTIYNVKSHLQKYRDLKASLESAEGNSKVTTSAVEQASPVDLKACMTITEALRMQMKVQKQLHEQLEIQRKLQIRIEEQGKYLLQMLEHQNKAEDRFKSAPCKRDRSNPPDYGSEASDLDRVRGTVSNSSSQVLRETPHASKGKQKVTEGTPPVKRLRIDDGYSGTSSYI